MNSLRDLTRSSKKECSLRAWATKRKISFPLSLLQLMSAYAPPRLWGFADLHAHPASHLSFGANADGTDGLFHGNPSSLPAEAAIHTIANDLAPCDGKVHSQASLDPVKNIQRTIIMLGIEDSLTHEPTGYPGYKGWPSASSLSHQQMHISSIHRAWEGGLRLMIASVTDSQPISRLWRRPLGSGYPDPDPNFDINSARRQILFIRAQANANAAWMQIVTTPAEARQAISANKLAIILGVEMDKLTVEQIIDLKTTLGVRQVVPIHLTNNMFGGVAVYNDLFNTNNWYLQGGKCFSLTDNPHLELFFQVYRDYTLAFRLSNPRPLVPITYGTPIGQVSPFLPPGVPFQPGIILPIPMVGGDSLLGYNNPPCTPGDPLDTPESPEHWGHRNKLGLVQSELLKLMRVGMIIDLAHMSDSSQEQALNLADEYNYPLVNTHTAMRPNDWKEAASERDMRRGLVEQMSRRGGIIGFGTAGYWDGEKKTATNDQLGKWIEDYWDMWNAMNFHGVAIGTDMNGLSPQIPNSLRPFSYEEAGLTKSKIGSREFDFADDGLAHYGMLADFIHALRKFENGVDIADHFLFRTAEDTIIMWEKVEQAATRIP